MQLSMFTDYALRVIVHLADDPDRKMSTRQIAEIHGAKLNHMSKVTGWLVAEGYLSAQRGRGGGLRLARDVADISLGTLLRQLEAEKPLVECMGAGGSCRLTPACGLSVVLGKAQKAFFATLDPINIADVLHASPGMPNLLRALNQSTPGAAPLAR